MMALGSGGPVVFVDDAAEDSSSPDRRVERDYDGGIVLGRALAQSLVRAVPVEMREVLVEDLVPAGYYVRAGGSRFGR